MIKHILFFLLFPITAFAAGGIDTTAELLNITTATNTECATAEFNNALIENSYMVNENDDRDTVRDWIYDILQSPEVLGAVLSCPEIADAEENTTLFMPIKYTFPNGRTVEINYETQPKVLEQRFMLSTKTELPTDDPNPAVSSTDEHATWVNTEPAWYGIMVVQSGALREFVGPNKNNTVSMKWVEDNIDNLYPRNMDGWCSTKTGIGAKTNNAMVHDVIRERTAAMDDDKNNYYIAGDRNLKWISVTEIVVDIVLSVVSYGGFTVAQGLTKGARATRIGKKLKSTLRTLARIPEVGEYIKKANQVRKIMRNTENAEKFAKSFKNVAKLEERLSKATKGSKKYSRIEKQLENARKLHLDNAKKLGQGGATAAKTMTQSQAKHLTNIDRQINKIKSIEPSRRTHQQRQQLLKLNQEKNTILNKIGTKDPAEIARLQQSALNGSTETIIMDLDKIEELKKTNVQEIEKLQKEMAEMARADKNVAEYVKEFDTLKDVMKYSKELKTFKTARTGNIFHRTWQGAKNLRASAKAARTGTKTLDRAEKVARQASKSGRVRDWLFHSTMRNASRVARLGADLAALNFVIGLVGGFYDWADTDTDEFTNGISMKPFLLLSADSIEGQDNVVNYGMWLMWAGDSTNATDDDTAYLQAMDFAQKFYQDLTEMQDETGRHACDVDIYVVRPIIRNPDTDFQELYWLVMNDEPWSTATAE